MAHQILIIGLGHFGMALARTLTEKGAEVLAVDKRKNLVEDAGSFVTEAVVMDATEETELAKIEPKRRDTAICAIGDDSKESSIICTALLRQMGAPHVVARANDAMHQRILKLVGAHQIINPEQEFGQKYATKLLHKGIVADTSISGDIHLTELKLPESMQGKTLKQLELPKKYKAIVVGVRRGEQGQTFQPTADDELNAGDTLIVAAKEDAMEKLLKGEDK